MIYFGSKKNFFFLLIIFILFSNNSLALDNKIVVKINNDIITSLDVDFEIKYLKTLNKEFQKLEYKTIYNVAKNSLIRETIKKNEILKYVKNLKIDEKYLNDLIKKTYSKIGIKNEKEFKNYINKKDLNLNIIKNKITIEALWNQLIFSKYSSKINIDENRLRKKLQNLKNEKIKIYSLSEVLFEVKKKENYKKMLENIKKSINDVGFENTATIYSLSDSAKLGGNIGWIEETSLSKNIKLKLSKININEITEPTPTFGGYLILKINDIKYKNIKIDFEKELDSLIKIETNKQFNQYSNIYYKKLKMDSKINEL